jgi:TetR/AcrR family transcriptional repressor of bet genes
MAKPVLRDTKPVERLSRARQRLKLIDACITALHQHGPSRTTIDKVVTIADMSPGIVNFYFETKAALLVAALEHLAVEFEQLVLEPLAELSQTPMAALDRLIDLYLDPNVASARKVSVWYSFWGESNSRREYYTICGKRDVAFAALVQDLVARVIRETRLSHLDADAVALGLIGCLEMMWQEIAFQDEADVDREAAKKRCRAYLRSVFAGHFGVQPGAGRADLSDAAELSMFRRSWQFGCSALDIPHEGDYVAWQSAVDRVLIVRGGGSAISAFVNTCLHRPHLLVAGEFGRLASAFACSADGTVYGLDGVRQTGGVLQPLHVAVQGAMIFVTHEVEKAGEAPLLPAACMAPGGAWRSFDVSADWKLVVEHWADAYFDTDARAFGAGARMALTDDESALFSQAHTVRGEGAGYSANMYVRLCASLDKASTVRRRLIWPNLFVEERPDGVTIRQVLPLAHGKSRVRVRRYGPAAADRAARAMAFLAARVERAWERDDVRAIETTQGVGGAQEAGAALMAWRARKNVLF